ncbi:hypothetical protein BBJ29_004537 [Phytophthora kernoviae]|nr:hypothetical protein BBJ29_004537 [Phytophthora kernoviae]
MFSGANYLMIDVFAEEGCESYTGSNIFLAAGTCQLASYMGQRSEIATLFNDGSAYMTIYNDSACGKKAQTFDLNASTVQEHTCYRGYNKFYTTDNNGVDLGSNSGNGSTTGITTSTGESNLSTGALVGIVVACLGIVICPALLVYWRMRRAKKGKTKNRNREPDSMLAISDKNQDEERYAVDMSPRKTRKSMRHVKEFLTEVKMMTMMNHPRVVKFIGVSWTNLMDLCVVTEFMEGGDLRSWLSDRADNECPIGFDYIKVKIAAHVVHALAYLHSLNPPLIHRDLKSRNILLNKKSDAKLADFGASRERVDRTMTAGVGTSLWIAPEVMMGERYDEKADMFSFGVVLSELDSQLIPYAHAKENNKAGRKMPETAILQLVAMGKLRVEFSPGALKGMVQLGTECTAIDPTERPTAEEALAKLQALLAQEAKRAGKSN